MTTCRSLGTASLLARLALLALPFATACTHTESEWQMEQDRHHKEEEMLRGRADALDKELAAEKQKVEALERSLKDQGMETSKLSMSLADKDRALAEYKARARQLEIIKARFDLLRSKLDTLTRLGLGVSIRKNRMVISMPGDVLFDTGKDTLSRQGDDILKAVAEVIRHDKSLSERDYQVAGHTDNQPLAGGPFHDNWGLSLMRARSVLLYLVGKGGGLPRQHWSAAGFADTDPIAPNTGNDGRQKNRRCELIVVPDAEELIDLRQLTR